MYGYADLPSLVPVIDTIIGFLSVKERIKFKSVCRSWKAEIELREQKSNTLVLHFGPYRWNTRWSQTNNGGLMKFENSFEVKAFTFLEHSLARSLLERTKKLAILNSDGGAFNQETPDLQPYLGYFKHCEEIEIRKFPLQQTLTFNLPKLKVLVINEIPVDKLVLNCPLLEVLFWNSTVQEIKFQNVKKLKRLICFGWPANISLDGKFESLEYLNLFTVDDERVNDRLLDLMPRLKRFVLYSSNPHADLESIHTQQKRFGLKNLEILSSGFRDPVKIALNHNSCGFVVVNLCVEQLFDNYSKLVENSLWKVSIDYSQLFSQFKILPNNFFERFSEPCVIEISKVTNYTHLFGFLQCYPVIQQLRIHFSKVKANQILDLVHSLQPSLTNLAIVEVRPSDVLKIDLSFMRLFNLALLNLESTRLPVEFVRKVAAKRGPHFTGIVFEEITTGHEILICFDTQGSILINFITEPRNYQFSSVKHLITGMQSDPRLNALLLI